MNNKDLKILWRHIYWFTIWQRWSLFYSLHPNLTLFLYFWFFQTSRENALFNKYYVIINFFWSYIFRVGSKIIILSSTVSIRLFECGIVSPNSIIALKIDQKQCCQISRLFKWRHTYSFWFIAQICINDLFNIWDVPVSSLLNI